MDGGRRQGAVWARWLLPAAVVVAMAPRPAAAVQEVTIDAETARAMLARQAREGGWWVASNAEHRARNDALPDFYAIRHELAPGGFASTGCMWGGRDGRTLGPFWTFLTAWDPREEALLVYQVSPGGAVGIGHAVETDEGEVALQEVHAPGQPPGRIRHLTTHPHPDTLVTRSFDWRDGEWAPRRHDSWVWTPAEGRTPPC